MELLSLQSGSDGNCLYVETADAKLLFDAGISGVRAEERLAAADRDIWSCDAVIVSHDHWDHVRSAGIFGRKYGLPIHMTERTEQAAGRHLGVKEDVVHFRSGDVLTWERTRVETIHTTHDGADGVAFVVDDGTHRLGILTDLGHVFAGLADVIATLDAVFIESNYDGDLLDDSPYSAALKKRIRGKGGHLSNGQSARLVAHAQDPVLQWICLAHLSEEANDPELALATAEQWLGLNMPIHVAPRHDASEVWTL